MLEALKKIPCPPPLPYLGDEPGDETAAAKTSKASKKKKKKETGAESSKASSQKVQNKRVQKNGDAKSSKSSSEKVQKATSSEEVGGENVYKAGNFQRTYTQFLQDQREAGMSVGEARQKWKDSSVRAELLKNMSDSEKRRRRFN